MLISDAKYRLTNYVYVSGTKETRHKNDTKMYLIKPSKNRKTQKPQQLHFSALAIKINTLWQ